LPLFLKKAIINKQYYKNMFDTIIIGSGPAGLTAAIYATRREMKTLIIGKELGGQIIWAGEIENYPGFKTITNFEFIERFRDQAVCCGAELKEAEVKKIEKKEDGTFVVMTNKEEFLARTVIVAMGLSPRRLAVAGEIEFNGRGVSYCANCDGPLYKGKKVAVVGGGNSAFDAAEFLSKIAEKVYLIHRTDEFKAFNVLMDEVKSKNNVEIITNALIKEIKGENKVERLVYTDKISGKDSEILIDGIFVEVGRIASTDLIDDFADRDNRLQIVVNNRMETKTPGLFAAGDVTSLSEYKQITIACGQATAAALAAYQYIQRKEGINKEVRDY
jgi:thioredoxin-disulfide reductase